jgi:hypothetical protein
MATATQAQRRAMTSLPTVELMLGDLPDVAAEWESLDAAERDGWSLDWSNEMSGLRRLAQDASEGLLTSAQEERYHVVLEKLREALPTVERLALYVPPIGLNERQ